MSYAFELAKKIVENGKLKSVRYFCEGDIETGPYSVEYKYIEFAGLKLMYYHTNGSLIIESKQRDNWGYARYMKTIYHSYRNADNEEIKNWAKKVQRYFWSNCIHDSETECSKCKMKFDGKNWITEDGKIGG